MDRIDRYNGSTDQADRTVVNSVGSVFLNSIKLSWFKNCIMLKFALLNFGIYFS